MKQIFSKLTSVVLLVVSLLLMSAANENQLSAVVNESVSETEVSFAYLKSIFKAQKTRWKDGSKITLVMLKPESAGGALMCSKVFGQSASDVNKFYMALVFQGQITAPKFCSSDDELKAYVKNTKGAIGLLPAKDAAGAKTIKVDGNSAF